MESNYQLTRRERAFRLPLREAGRESGHGFREPPEEELQLDSLLSGAGARERTYHARADLERNVGANQPALSLCAERFRAPAAARHPLRIFQAHRNRLASVPRHYVCDHDARRRLALYADRPTPG